MRIAFVCAGAEPGGDGVGDYTRRLAGELRRRGQNAAILALNDRALGAGLQRGDNELRLSRVTPWSVRMRKAREFLEEFGPDVLSLQFVGYGFDPRGLPLGLATKLRTLAGGIPWHVMFHELWIEPEGDWTHRVLSRLQKAHIVDLCRALAPKVVHTSNPYYTARLESAGIACAELPLFGNIPVVPHESPRNPEEWVFAFFGSLRRGWDPEPLLSKIESACVAAGKKSCRFVSLGRLGAHGESVWERMEKRGYEKFVFEKRGELAAVDISRALQSADYGIAASTFYLLGKSGAFAAMREHGLPLVVSRLVPETAPAARPCSSAFSTSLASGTPAHSLRSVMESTLAEGRWMKYKSDAFPPLVLLNDNFEINLLDAKRTSCQETLSEVADAFLNEMVGILFNGHRRSRYP
jgi:hypothetical protein